MPYCEDCGCKMQGAFCPNCHEERLIVDQYIEQDMDLPPADSEFMKKAVAQEADAAQRSLKKGEYI